MADVLPTSLPFASRRALMPMWGQAPLPPEQWQARWQSLEARALPDDTLAYVHIPFCANHCVFCGFYRNGWQPDNARRYTDRLIAELYADATRRVPGGQVRALYLGGGTPTLLDAADLTRLLDALRATLPLSEDCEITVEGRISHFGPDKVDACLRAGVNRFSIGVQTFDSAIRRRLGRKHGGAAAAEYLAWLADYSRQVVVADLIFGLPGQDASVWQRDLDTAMSLGLSGVDVYAFNLMPQLPIVRMIEKGAFPPAPGLGAQLARYLEACERLLGAGWTQLSNSHFAAAGSKERNHYNLAIKSGVSCLAFGAGAGGKLDGVSYAVEPELARYLATPDGDKPLARMACADAAAVEMGALQGQIETGAITLATLATHPSLRALLETWARQQLLTLDATHARLTLAGRFWGPSIARQIADTLYATPVHPIPRHPAIEPLKESA